MWLVLMLVFFAFLGHDVSPWGYRNRYFLVALCRLIVRRLNLEEGTKRYLHQQVKILSIVSAMWCMEVCLYCYFRCCGYFWGLWMSFVKTDDFSMRVAKVTGRIDVSWTHSLPFCFWHTFNSMKWPNCQKDVNQITLNYTVLWNIALPVSRNNLESSGSTGKNKKGHLEL